MIQEDRALLAAVSVLLLAAACGEDPVEPGMVASLAIEPDSVSLTYGQTVQLSAVARDPNGQPLQGKNTTWVSLTPGVATVSATGLVTAAEWGRVEIRALVEGKAATAVILVGDTGPQDFSITDAQFTQGVQSANGSVPLILDGNPAVLNLLIRARQPASAPMQVVLRLFDGATRLIRSDTVTVAGTARGAPSYLAPSAQFLVPADVLDSAAQWEVARDPRGRIPDDSSGNDAFPRSGPALILALPVPAVKLRFVPMVLTAHSGATGAVTEQLLTEYLQTARSVLPLGVISPVIGSALTTGAFFGTPPSGGEAAFWQQVLSELDMARVASAAPEEHWYGVVRPPAGFTFTTFGGFGYIPGSGQSTGPHTRTAVGVQVGWFSRPTQARDLVAHELGHNFGRRHSPCGGPSGVDPDYPRADGTIGLPGHDVYAWAHGLAIFAPVISPQTGDVMGYCYPMWASEYT
ncbi:MAG TPA: Ig-like domain-containing protein, partial [Gemmatimonadales bacterium]|nr:Ig-like domain-containing protein [Gemmatimonadales bacterium]